MTWSILLAHFFGGVFLANGVPHFVHGVSGKPFQTPFASPPGRGLSSSIVNLLWGFANLVVGAILIARIGPLVLGDNADALAFGLGVLAIGLGLAWHFGRLNGGARP